MALTGFVYVSLLLIDKCGVFFFAAINLAYMLHLLLLVLSNRGKTIVILSFQQPCTCTVSTVIMCLCLSFIVILLYLTWIPHLTRPVSLETRPSWIASVLLGSISHSILDYPLLGYISHSGFIWPSLGGISNAQLVILPSGALTGCRTGRVTTWWWICLGLTLLGLPILAVSGYLDIRILFK